MLIEPFICYFLYTAGLLPVNDIHQDNGNLIWNEPLSTPAGCIASYTVTWGDSNYTTADNRTSLPINSTTGLEFCRIYSSIDVTPNVPKIGAIQNRAELLNVALIPPGIYICKISHVQLRV